MLGLSKAFQRFSLYHLDEGELYIKEYLSNVEFTYPSNQEKMNLNGVLYLGSRSLIFEPEDKNISLIKFSFKYLVNLPILSFSDSTINFSTTRMIQIIGNFTEPYKIYTIANESEQLIKIKIKYEKIEIVSKIISELIVKFNSKESSFQFDSLDYLGTLYNFTFDLTLIKSVNEKFIYNNQVYVKQMLPLIEVPGILRITDIRLYFQPIFKISSKKSINVKFSSMTQLFKRRLHLMNIGLEIVTNKKSLLLEFENQNLRDTFYSLIFEHKNDECEIDISIEKFTSLWIQGKISNYEYLIKLNSAANRTRNNLSQYPIFPWTITNWTSEIIDLNNKDNYRDLSKPIGALNPSRLKDFLNRFKDMPEPKFIYGTHYSTSAYVIGYLARKYPEYMLKLHSGRFDNPDRVFNSIDIDWNICYNNPSSLKELIPEFYENNSDFLLNEKHINLGVTAKGQKIGNVILPLWSENNPKIFLDTMKSALESEYVSENLHLWIDLIFGYKQRGEEAIKANNLFHPVSYEDGSGLVDKTEEEIKIIQVQAAEFGQCPTQLFHYPHPKKYSNESIQYPINFEGDKLKIVSIDNENPHNDNIHNFIFHNIQFKELNKHHRDEITSSGFLFESQILLTGSSDGYLKIFDLKTNTTKRLLSISNLKLTSIAEINDSNIVAIGSANNKIYFLNTTLGKSTSKFDAHEDSVIGIFYSQKINKLISDGADSVYKLWDINKKIPEQSYFDTEGEIVSCDYREKDNLHICVDIDGNVALRNMNDKEEVSKFVLNGSSFYNVKFDCDDVNKYYISNDESLDIYDTRMNKIINSVSEWKDTKYFINENECFILSDDNLYLNMKKISEPSSVVIDFNQLGKCSYLMCKYIQNDHKIIIGGNQDGNVYYYYE